MLEYISNAYVNIHISMKKRHIYIVISIYNFNIEVFFEGMP